jgi:hypothetical protein
MDAAQLFLYAHARLHSRAVAPSEGRLHLQTIILDGLSEEQIRAQPPRLNSIAWSLWHAARWEDALPVVIAGRPQLWHQDNWCRGLGVQRDDGGVGMSPEECDSFNRQINVSALLEYRAAVGRRTRELVLELQPHEWDEPAEEKFIELAWDQGMLAGDRADWVRTFSAGRTKAYFITLFGLVHINSHIGEMMAIRGQFDVPAIGEGGFPRRSNHPALVI